MVKDAPTPQDAFFQYYQSGNAPWEIDQPQPEVIKMVEKGIFHGELLDVGCGTAENTIYIANHTNNVNITAIDLVNSFDSFFFGT